MGKRMAWVRRWFAILYGIAFIATLLYMVATARVFTNDFWMALVSASKAAELQLHVVTLAIETLVVVIAVVTLGKLIERVDRQFLPMKMVGANPNFALLTHRWLRYPFAALLIYNLPILAMLEEFIFRTGLGRHPVLSPSSVIVSCLLFGLFHALISWNFRSGILQFFLGFWFCYQYLNSGPCEPLIHASFSHFLVDLFAFVPGALKLCLNPRALVLTPRPACS